MVRAPCERMGLMKGPWTPEEDKILVSYIQRYGHGNWRSLPNQAGLPRCGKSCRLRWTNYLRPDIKRGNFTSEEEEAIIKLHELLGNKWSAIAARLPGRTDNEIKNVWHTHLKKRLKQNVSTTSATKKQVFEENHPPSQLHFTNSPQLSPHQSSSHASSIHTTSKSSPESDDGMWSEILTSESVVLDSMSIEYCSRPPKQPCSGETMDFWYNEFMEPPNLKELPSLDSITLDSLLGSVDY